jgi:hypothetical protein
MARTVGFKKQRVVAALEELGVRFKDGKANKSDVESILQVELETIQRPNTLGTSILEYSEWCARNPKLASLVKQNLDLREQIRKDVAKMQANAQVLAKAAQSTQFPTQASVDSRDGFIETQEQVLASLDAILESLRIRIG